MGHLMYGLRMQGTHTILQWPLLLTKEEILNSGFVIYPDYLLLKSDKEWPKL